MNLDCRIECSSLVVAYPPSLIAEMCALLMQGFSRYPWGGPESGGVLFGTHDADAVRILAFRPLSCEHAEGPAYTLSPNDEAALEVLLGSAKQDPDLAGLEPVGWYHSLYQDLYVSHRDTEVHDRFFPNSWQIAVIVRRAKLEPARAGLYCREDGGPLRFGGEFSCEEKPRQAEPLAVEQPSEPVAAEPEAAEEATAGDQPRRSSILAGLLAAIQNRRGLILLIAQSGPVTTEVLRSLGDLLNEHAIEFALLPSPPATAQEFYEALAWDLALPCSGKSKTEVLFSLNDLLVQQARSRSTTVLILENAQSLSREVLEEIRLFENLQNRSGRLLQVILSGTSELMDRLDEPELAQLKQQVAVRYCVP